jgi:hypothetical protein
VNTKWEVIVLDRSSPLPFSIKLNFLLLLFLLTFLVFFFCFSLLLATQPMPVFRSFQADLVIHFTAVEAGNKLSSSAAHFCGFSDWLPFLP